MNEPTIIEIILNFLKGEAFSIFGTVASMISLVLTVWVLINVGKIKSYYMFAARVPDLNKQLKQHASEISAYLNDFEGFLPQIQLELAQTEIVLRSLKNKLDRQPKKSATQLLKVLRHYDLNSGDKDGLYSIYVDMRKLESEIEDLQEDLKWER
jgi:hypothetical protein